MLTLLQGSLDAALMADERRPAGAPPSDNDRLKAIRAHADRTMRYYATAFLRETEEHRDLMRAYMDIRANFLSLLDRDELDDRSMLDGRGRIVQEYLEQRSPIRGSRATAASAGNVP
jgi:hypothetical protein